MSYALIAVLYLAAILWGFAGRLLARFPARSHSRTL